MKIEVFHNGNKIDLFEMDNAELVNGAELFIGRAPDCHIVLDDKQISRNHATIFFEISSFKVRKDSSWGQVIYRGSSLESSEEVIESERLIIGDFALVITQLDHQPSTESEEVQRYEDEEAATPDDEVSEEATAILDNLEELSDGPEDEDLLIDETHEDDDVDDEVDVDGGDATQEIVSEDFSHGGLENVYEEQESQEESFEDGVFADDSEFTDDDGDDGFGTVNEEVGDSTQVFKSFAKYYLEIDGEYAPFDRYQIDDNEVIIGRDSEKADIVLNDPEVSTEHAVIKKTLVNCFITDLNSSNGTILNGKRINKEELSNNDSFQIGTTLFTVKIESELLETESEGLMPVLDNQEVEVEEIIEEEVDYDELAGEGEEFDPSNSEEKSVIKRIMKDPKKRMIAIVVGLVAVLFLFDSEDEAPSVSNSKTTVNTEKPEVAPEEEKSEVILSPDVLARMEENYVLALSKYELGEYYEAKEYLDIVRSIDPNYKDTQTLSSLISEGYEQLLRLKAEEEAEKERKKRQVRISGLLERAKDAVEKREVQVAHSFFAQILELDPENIEVSPLRLEIEAYEAEEKRKQEEEARKRALRQAMLDALQPGKNLFLREDWYLAILELEKFTMKEGMDEDLMREAAQMLRDSKTKLNALVDPLLGRSRAYKDGQDLKRAYETYGEVLDYEPSNEEALNERERIFSSLRSRSMQIYREALISESLSLFDEAKEKFEEVQQVSPIGTEYYEKASDKLKSYPE